MVVEKRLITRFDYMHVSIRRRWRRAKETPTLSSRQESEIVEHARDADVLSPSGERAFLDEEKKLALGNSQILQLSCMDES